MVAWASLTSSSKTGTPNRLGSELHCSTALSTLAIPIGICENTTSKPDSESSTPYLHQLAILTGLNELQTDAKALAFFTWGQLKSMVSDVSSVNQPWLNLITPGIYKVVPSLHAHKIKLAPCECYCCGTNWLYHSHSEFMFYITHLCLSFPQPLAKAPWIPVSLSPFSFFSSPSLSFPGRSSSGFSSAPNYRYLDVITKYTENPTVQLEFKVLGLNILGSQFNHWIYLYMWIHFSPSCDIRD